MASFSLVCIVWITICLNPLAAEPISAYVGSRVVLPCQLRVPSETPYIRWSSDKDVFERSGKDSFQGEGYEGRVDVPEDQLHQGDCSLVLYNLTIADKGVYKSFQVVRRRKRSTQVKDKWLLIDSIELDVQSPPQGKRIELALSSDAKMNWPHPQVLVLSLLSCFLFQFFYKRT